MSKSKNKNTKYNPKEILKDINKILNLTKVFESDISKLDVEAFSKKVDKVNKEINEKVVWPKISHTITRLKPFLNFNVTEAKMIMKEVFVND